MPYKPVERECPGCHKRKAYAPGQEYCSLDCRLTARRVVPTSPSEREAHLRREVQRLNADVTKLLDLRGLLTETAERVAAAVTVATPPALVVRSGKSAHRTPFSAVLQLSDWQIGERISASETSGFGEYNWAIAQRRIAMIVAKFREWIETHRAHFNIPELVVLAEGDFVSGDIHRELSVTNEFPVPVQIARAGLLLGRAVSELSQAFENVRLVEIGGDNHGRYQPKPQFKQKAANNASYLVYTIANQFLAEHANVTPTMPDGFQTRVEIAGKQFLCEHGDNVKAVMGIPYYGMARHKGREAQRRMADHLYYDYMALGHWHVPAIIEGNILVNGSLCGTTEYDHGFGRHAHPAQVSFLVHPKWGIFDWTAWRVA